MLKYFMVPIGNKFSVKIINLCSYQGPTVLRKSRQKNRMDTYTGFLSENVEDEVFLSTARIYTELDDIKDPDLDIIKTWNLDSSTLETITNLNLTCFHLKNITEAELCELFPTSRIKERIELREALKVHLNWNSISEERISVASASFSECSSAFTSNTASDSSSVAKDFQIVVNKIFFITLQPDNRNISHIYFAASSQPFNCFIQRSVVT